MLTLSSRGRSSSSRIRRRVFILTGEGIVKILFRAKVGILIRVSILVALIDRDFTLASIEVLFVLLSSPILVLVTFRIRSTYGYVIPILTLTKRSLNTILLVSILNVPSKLVEDTRNSRARAL